MVAPRELIASVRSPAFAFPFLVPDVGIGLHQGLRVGWVSHTCRVLLRASQAVVKILRPYPPTLALLHDPGHLAGVHPPVRGRDVDANPIRGGPHRCHDFGVVPRSPGGQVLPFGGQGRLCPVASEPDMTSGVSADLQPPVLVPGTSSPV